MKYYYKLSLLFLMIGFLAIGLLMATVLSEDYKFLAIDSTDVASVTTQSDHHKKHKKSPRKKEAKKVQTRPLAPTVTATMTDELVTDTGIPGPSVNDIIEYKVRIDNTGPDDASGVMYTNTIDINTTLVPMSLKVSPIAVNDSYNVTGNIAINVPIAQGLLANDINPGGGTLSVLSIDTMGIQGLVTINSNGSFTFNPAPGFTGTTSFQYVASNGMLTDTASVSFTVTNVIWFIDNSLASTGDGRLSSPFNSIANFNSIASGGGNNHTIYLFRNTASSYSGTLALKPGQILIGNGATQTISAISGITPPIHSLSLPATGGTNPVISNAANSVTLSTNNKLHGFNISNTGGIGLSGNGIGNLEIRNMSISNSSGTALNLQNGALDVNLLSLSANNAAQGFTLSQVSGSFTVTGVGTTAGSGGTISNISARGADIRNASNISLSNMNLTNANTAAAGPCDNTANNLGCNGSIYLHVVSGITLTNVSVTGAVQQGLNGNTVTNLAINNSSFLNNGNAQFRGSLKLRDLQGTVTITNSDFANAGDNLVEIINSSSSTALSLTVNNNTFRDNISYVSSEKAIFIELNSNVSNSIIVSNNDFLRLQNIGVNIFNNAGTLTANIIDNDFLKNGQRLMRGVEMLFAGTSTNNVNVLRNTVEFGGGTGINVEGRGNSIFQARINNNTVIGPRTCSSCATGGEMETSTCSCFGDGITVWSTQNGNGIANVNNNNISDVDYAGRGIYASSRNSAALSILMDGNTINVATDANYGIDILSSDGTSAGSTTLCAALQNNQISVSSGGDPLPFFAHVRARAATNGTVRINGPGTNLATTWDSNSNSPVSTSLTFSSTAAGSGSLTFGQTCNTTLLHPSAITVPNDEVATESQEDKSTPETLTTYLEMEQKIAFAQVENHIEQEDNSLNKPTVSGGSRAGETVEVGGMTGFTLPAGKNIRIEYRVSINPDVPITVCTISNQGEVTGTNFSTVLTDDPSVAGSNNPTETTLQSMPSITFCPSDTTLVNDMNVCFGTLLLEGEAVGCPTPAITYSINASPIAANHQFPVGVHSVTMTATNNNGSVSCTFSVTVLDTQNPTLTCPASYQRNADLDSCSYTVQGTELDPPSFDNCPFPTIINSFNNSNSLNGEEFPVGVTAVTWTITDASNNSTSCTLNVEVLDAQGPNISCPGLLNTDCDINDLPPYSSISDFIAAGGSVSDNCGINESSFTLSEQILFNTVYIRTYSITDIYGLSNSCTQTITVNDVTPPVVTAGTIDNCYPTVAALEAAAINATTAFDNCQDNLTFSASVVGNCSASVTVVVTDGAGNSSQTTYQSRIDNTPPTMTEESIAACYATVAEAEAAAILATTVSDNCPGEITTIASTQGLCEATITVTSTDECGNSASVTYSTRIDNQGPAITQGTIAACYPTVAAAEAAALMATSATDNCSGTITYSASTVGDCSATITVTATDGCGNSSFVTFNTRIDNTPPTLTTGTIENCYPTVAEAEAAALAATTPSDNCPGQFTSSVSTDGTCMALITVSFSDECGNSASTSYSTRIDNTPPVLTPGTIADCYASAQLAEAAALAATTVSDNCPGILSSSTSTDGDCAAVITVTFVDGCGNSNFITYNTRIDNTPPVITPGTIGACYATQSTAEAAAIAATMATDNCLGTITFSASTVGDCSASITVTATDFCGNSSSTVYQTRIDNTPPTMTEGTIAACYATVAEAEAAAILATTVSDNCPGEITTIASTQGLCEATITVTSTDECGNSASVTYSTRIDNEEPAIIQGTIADCYPTIAAAEAAALMATSATDNCIGTITYSASTVGDCSATITVTATDGCGNSSFVTFNTRIDNTPPTLITGTIENCYPTTAEAEAAALAATIPSDNCPGQLTSSVTTDGTCMALITISFSDECGNSASTTYSTRIDSTPPVLTPGTIADCYASAQLAEAAALAATTVSDNCPGILSSSTSTDGDCAAVITVTFVDGCGNSNFITYNTRIDNIPPVITPGTIDACYATQSAAEAAAIAATMATDNCLGTITFSASTVGDCSASITVTATDFCGNSSSTVYQTRIDNTPPTMTEGSIAACYATVAEAEAAAILATTVTDNCPGEIQVTAQTVGSCTATITVTAIDECGNVNTVQYETRIDATGPTIIPGEISTCYPTVVAAEAAALSVTGAIDDCLSSVVFTVSTVGDCSATVTVTATDGCDNSTSYDYQTRIDNVPPTAICKVNTIFVGVGAYILQPEDVFDAEASFDNCPGDLEVISIIPATLSCNQLDETITVQVIVRDFCGYQDTCYAMITVAEDNALPAPWQHQQINNTPGTGQIIPCLADGTFEITSIGSSGPTIDNQNFIEQTLCGNGQIIARVVDVTNNGIAGIEMRESLAPGSVKVSLKTQLTFTLRRQIRSITNGPSQTLLLTRPNQNWLRLERSGNQFVGYTSTNGINWNFAFAANIAMPNCIHVGMMLESINSATTTTALFDNVSIIGGNPLLPIAVVENSELSTWDVSILPNPATSVALLEVSNLDKNKTIEVEVFNAVGSRIEQFKVNTASTYMDISAWPAGIYWVQSRLGDKMVTKKLIKVN